MERWIGQPPTLRIRNAEGSDVLDWSHLTAPVVPTVGADLMRRLPLVALRALTERDRIQFLVGPSLRGARLGVPALRISHARTSFLTGPWVTRGRRATVPPAAGTRLLIQQALETRQSRVDPGLFAATLSRVAITTTHCT